MMEVGRVKQLWCYPVKSMQGAPVDHSRIEKTGMLGDRNWALRDESIGELTTVRKLPKLLKFKAIYHEDTAHQSSAQQNISHGKVANVSITMPDGSTVSSQDRQVNQKLSEAIGRPVTLWPLQPKTNIRHYLLKVPAGAEAMKKQFATKNLPDFSSVTWRMMMELAVFVTPLGRYHDVYPLHLLTTNSLEKLRQLEPDGDFRVERFRPNLLIEACTGEVDFAEFAWVDGTLYIGDTVLQVVSRTVRCSMPAQPQATLQKDAKVLRALEAHTQRHLGVNISVLKAGAIRVGDPVLFEPSDRSALARRLDAVSAGIRNRAIQRSFKLIDRLAKIR
ncbi:MAG: MOSC N-terminal beta barrel domain-containing protein [Moraxellaceae bacterium]